ncbi:hypothetical protein KR018_001746 [Drosophila ironensis]|nr:hypothetical protein KR018_001746 [Drosophila ironensis]
MRRNLRLDWRALALLGALLSIIITWPGLGQVFAMPASMPAAMLIPPPISTNNSNSSLQSDHSLSSLVPSVVSEYPPANQSIIAEYEQSLTAIETSTSTGAPQSHPIHTPSNSNQLEEPLGFVLSAVPSAHLAVLSRTERSIRHEKQSNQNAKQKHHQQQHRPMADGNFIGSKSKRLSNSRSNLQINSSSSNTPVSNLDRNERSTVPQSHLDWTSRKIQLYIKKHILQLMRDGTVNGTQDENSEFTILQRSTVDVGRIKLQSVATCLYLCMDACGVAYGSKDFTDDCVFNENMGLQSYNTYTSTYNSNPRRVLYLALNNQGELRRTQIPMGRELRKLSIYTNAITETVLPERVEQLIAKNFGANRVKHGVRQLCDTGKPLIPLIDAEHFKAPPTCNANSSSSSSSGSGSSSSNSSRNVPVPAVSASSLISISNSNQSLSGHISSSISSSNTSNPSNSSNHNHSRKGGGKGGGGNRNRKCKAHENERQHNCQRRGPGALRVLGTKARRCKELREKAAAEGGPPPNCGKKHGARKNQGVDPGMPVRGLQHQRSKQLGGKRKLGKQPGKQQRQSNNKKHQPLQQHPLQHPQSQAKGSKRKHRKMEQVSTSTTMATSLATPESHWESSSPLPAMALSETSDRVERHVRPSSIEEEHEHEQEHDQEQEQDPSDLEEQEPESLEDASYEDATSEAQGRSGAGDDSLYYDL